MFMCRYKAGRFPVISNEKRTQFFHTFQLNYYYYYYCTFMISSRFEFSLPQMFIQVFYYLDTRSERRTSVETNNFKKRICINLRLIFFFHMTKNKTKRR